jgi:predicted acetyltransferase
MSGMTLVEPSLERLEEYAAALRQGWSPNNVRDVSGEQLAAIATDPAEFVRGLVRQTGTIRLGDGREVPRLPGVLRWMWDGGFCGGIGLRYQPGTEELPPHALGHIGYAVVPWKRRRGYATEALRQVLPYAVAAGLRHVDLTCDADNRPSQKVIEANGGTEVGRMVDDAHGGQERLLYRIVLAGGFGPA